MKQYAVIALLSLFTLIIGTDSIKANSTENYSKDRSALMKKMDYALNNISDRIYGLFPYDKNAIRKNAETIHAGIEKLNELFPEGSASGATHPNIWKRPKDFQKIIAKASKSAAKLVDAAETASKSEMQKMAKKIHYTCTGCHSDFRKK